MSAMRESLRGLASTLGGMVFRAVVTLVKPTKLQSLQVMTDQPRDDVEHFEPYGFTSNPQPGAEAVVLNLAGDEDHQVAICVGDRRFRLMTLVTGEVALYDDQGQSVALMRGARVVVTTAGTVELAGVGVGVARLNDQVQATPYTDTQWAAWLTAVHGVVAPLYLVATGLTLTPPATPIPGVIASASTKVLTSP